MMKGISKNGKHSYRDFGAILSKRNIGYPSKRKIKVTIPYMNGSYDFSTALGEQIYDERPLQYIFKIVGDTKEELEYKASKLNNWLLNSIKEPLYDDNIKGFYFLAECEKVSVEENRKVYKITADFLAYPFKISSKLQGDDIWDTFNFLEDYSQQVSFSVNGIKEITLYNNGVKVSPEVLCTSEFLVNGMLFSSDVRNNNNFYLKNGENQITLEGNGDIEFIFRREVL